MDLNGWIDVKDERPKMLREGDDGYDGSPRSKVVFGADARDGELYICFMEEDGEWFDQGGLNDHITHWMEVPVLPPYHFKKRK
jgi:hypothetical protein